MILFYLHNIVGCDKPPLYFHNRHVVVLLHLLHSFVD